MNKQFTFFWDGPYSQWHPSKFQVLGKEFNCAEQYMMYNKALMFGDDNALCAIMSTPSPRAQKQYGREVRNFNMKLWNEHAKDIVYVGNHAKFTQHIDLLQRLLATSPTLLVEASPYDTVWGIGLGAAEASKTPQAQWKGTNWLGEVLTQVRDDILDNKPLIIEDYGFINLF